ncbi:MAG: DUF5668 domain-containing protein [Chitinophagaceae bacterium]
MDYRRIRDEHSDYSGFRREIGKRKERGRIVFGVFAAIAGLLLLLHNLFPQFGYLFHVSWPVILIIIGLAIGIKNNFRRNAWWILILIGGVYLVQPYFFSEVATSKIVWPSLLIILGLVMIFRNRNFDKSCRHRGFDATTSDADTLNVDVTFGGRKEIVTSKNFKGGTVKATFGGVEINLVSAESGPEPMVLDMYINFGGAELIVPAHWDIQNEISPTMGSVEDQRRAYPSAANEEKHLLILRGTCTFGSVEIKSY